MKLVSFVLFISASFFCHCNKFALNFTVKLKRLDTSMFDTIKVYENVLEGILFFAPQGGYNLLS